MRFRLPLLLLAAGRLHAGVDISRVPDSWTPTPPPPAAVEVYRKADMNCEAFFTRKDGNATLVYNSRKPTWNFDQSSCQGAIQGLIDGFAEAGSKRGRPAGKNEVIHTDGLELVCQEFDQAQYRTTILTQLTPSKLEQVTITYPPAERETAVKLATGLFTAVPPPPASKSSSKFDEGFRTGKVLGRLTAYLAIAGVVAAVIIISLLQKKRRRASTPPPLP